VRNVGAPLSMAKSASIQFVRTDISRPYTRYVTTMRSAPPVDTRQRFFRDFSTRSGSPVGVRAVTASTWRANSRTR